jgi:hypothetical protein
VTGRRFSDEWVEYLDMLHAFVRDCRASDVHLIDPLAIDEDGLDSLTVMGLGMSHGMYAKDPMAPVNLSARRLHRYLPLNLGNSGGAVSLCYYSLAESDAVPAYLILTHETTSSPACVTGGLRSRSRIAVVSFLRPLSTCSTLSPPTSKF